MSAAKIDRVVEHALVRNLVRKDNIMLFNPHSHRKNSM